MGGRRESICVAGVLQAEFAQGGCSTGLTRDCLALAGRGVRQGGITLLFLQLYRRGGSSCMRGLGFFAERATQSGLLC